MKKKRVYGKNPKTTVVGESPPRVKTEGRVRRLVNTFKNMAFKGRYEER